MTDNQFDNFVRAKLHDHSAPVPAGLWDKVNPAKDDDDRKGIIIPRKFRFGLPLLLLLLLAGSVTGYLIFSNQADSNTTAKQSVAQTDADQAVNKSSNQQNENKQDNNQLATTKTERNSADQSSSNPTESVNTTTALDEKPVVVGVETNNLATSTNTASKTGSKTSTYKNSPLAATNSNQPKSNTTSLDGEDAVTVNSSRKTITKADIEGMPAFTKATTNNRTSVPFVKQTAISQTNENKVTAEDETTEAIEYPVTFSGNFEPGNTISLSRKDFGLSGMMQRDNISSSYYKKFKNIIVCPPYSTRNSDWFAEVYVSPDMAFKSIENKTATQQYLQKKDSSESMRIGYTAGVRLVKPITDNFLIKTGIQYTQINEKFTYRTEDEVRTTTVISVRTIIRGPGDTLRIADTSTVQQTGFKTNAIKNRYRSFDIPVTVGYEFGNENLRFGVNAGVIFNISSWYQGVILDSSLSAIPISKGNNAIYKSNIGLGLYGGFSVLKKLGEDTQIFFEPYFRYNLSGITNGQASYQQRFSLGGIAIGLRYNLNRR